MLSLAASNAHKCFSYLRIPPWELLKLKRAKRGKRKAVAVDVDADHHPGGLFVTGSKFEFGRGMHGACEMDELEGPTTGGGNGEKSGGAIHAAVRAIDAVHRDINASRESGSPGSSRRQSTLEEEMREDLRIMEVRAWLEESVTRQKQGGA